MPINIKDDYGKLAKLLYPSIEASGNVYYGQTKKLTMDEILGKNELNFESHIESFKQGPELYKSYFNWRLGPLHGSVEIAPVDNTDGRTQGFQLPSVQSVTRLYKDGTTSAIDIAGEPALFIDGTVFIKYRIALDNVVVEQLTNSGSFPIYETSANCEISDIVVTEWFDPSNVNSFNIYDIENRNFFIEESDGDYYLYIQLMSDEIKSPDVVIDITEPLTFTALQPNSTVEFVWNDADDYEINKYDGYGWVSIPTTDFTVTLTNINDKVSIRYSSNVNTETSNPIIRFTGSIKASGNMASLITNIFDSDANSMINFSALNFKFEYMFANQTALTDVSELYINISGATTSCCSYMFFNCSNIIYPPRLITAVTASSCFEGMFSGCTKLRYAPELPAMSLTDHCYYQMFSNCTSLYSTPYLPATSMRQSCYDSMFSGCTGLRYAMSILPAKSLNQYCYLSMFSGCANLKIAPILPAVSTPRDCYSYMFSGCYSLSYVCCLIGNNLDYPPTIDHWLDNVSDDGKLLITNDAPQHLINSLPQNWQLVRLSPQDITDINNITVSRPKVGFNCRLSYSEEPDKYYYVITSGADSTKNGRGELNSTTTFNMLETNPILSSTIYDECDLNNGNSNQEIWGYKCFNSPVSFRNGIYGECASIITENPNCSSLNIRSSDNNDVITTVDTDYNLGSSLLCKGIDAFYSESELGGYLPVSEVSMFQSAGGHYISDSTKKATLVSQSQLISSNKLSNIKNNIRYVDDNAVDGNDNFADEQLSIIATSASICPRISLINNLYDYSEEYKSIVCAGNAYLKVKHIKNSDSSNSIIELYANEIDLDGGVTCYSPVHIDDDLDVLGVVNTETRLTARIISDEIDPNSYSARKDCLILGNTNDNNSGAFVVSTAYAYNTGMPIASTIPDSAEITLACVLNDEHGSELEKSYIKFNVNDNESHVTISGSGVSVSDGNNVIVEVDSNLVTPLISIAGDAQVDYNLFVGGDITANSNLVVSGNLTVNGTLIATDQATDLNVSGDLHVTGDATIDGQISVSGIGAIRLGGNNNDALELSAANNYDLVLNSSNSSVDIQGSTIYLSGSTTYISGYTSIGGNVNVTGSTITLGGATIDGSAYSVNINKPLNVTGNLGVTGQVLVGDKAIIGPLISPYYIGQYRGDVYIGTAVDNNGLITGGTLCADTVKCSTLDCSNISATSLNGSANINSISFASGFTHPFAAQGNLDNMPVGSLFLAYIEAPQTTLYPGEFLSNNGITNLYVVALNANGGVDFNYLQRVTIPSVPRYAYQVLNVVPTLGGIALVMRVA